MKRTLEAGFTLIELIVVIVILGILAAVAIPQFTDTAASARVAVEQGACAAVQSQAVLLYASNKGASAHATIASSVNTSNVAITSTACNGFTAKHTDSTTGTACNITLPSGLCN